MWKKEWALSVLERTADGSHIVSSVRGEFGVRVGDATVVPVISNPVLFPDFEVDALRHGRILRQKGVELRCTCGGLLNFFRNTAASTSSVVRNFGV